MRLPIVVAATALLAGTPALAQDRMAQVDQLFSWVKPGSPGCVVAVSHNGALVLNRSYGLASVATGQPLSVTSTFDAASLVKQFVAASVLLLAQDGKLALSDDVHRYIPELPDYGHTITIDHLLTHTSGIRDHTGVLPLADGAPDGLTLTLRQRGLNFAPGEEWAYSNGGYELLKEIIARVSGQTFGEFAHARFFAPLGMTSTAYQASTETLGANVAHAYQQEGDAWREDMHSAAERGSGALFSTPADLVTWGEALSSNRLGASVSGKIAEAATLNNGRQLSYGRGMFIDENVGGRVLWHTGGSAGYRSILVRHPEKRLVTAVMCNAGEAGDRTKMAAEIFDLFAGVDRSAEAAPPAAAVEVSLTELTPRAGLYFSEHTGQPLRVIVNSGRLGIAGAGPLVPLASDRFRVPRPTLSFMSQADFEVYFVSPDAFEMKTTEGAVTTYRRAQPFAPTAADLAAFAGRYTSDEVGSLLEIVANGEGIIMRSVASPEKSIELAPVDRDTFMRGMMTVRFIRDVSGSVVAYDYSNPVVRNIRYARVR